MDSTNNQIYKVAKYLDKYTKDGNKKGSMYLQKLNNYLHKVQHGGNGQAMDIVKQIQGMVGQVIGKHQDEREALTNKLQELRSNYSLDQSVNYESVKSMLEKKIGDAKTASLLSEASAASTAPQAQLTPDKIKNMTLKEFAIIAVNPAGITQGKGVNNVEKILNGLTFEQLTEEVMTPIFNSNTFFQLHPAQVILIIDQLVDMKAEIESEYRKLSMDRPTGRLIDIFKNDKQLASAAEIKVQSRINEQEQRRINEQEQQRKREEERLIQEWNQNNLSLKRLKSSIKDTQTIKFDVIGYVVNEDEILGDKFSEFIYKEEKKEKEKEEKEKEKEEKKIVFLDEKYRDLLLRKLELTDKIYESIQSEKNDQFRLTGAGIRIVLKVPMNIKDLLDRINDTETYIEIPTSQDKSIRVRLFIKPMIYSLTEHHTEEEEEKLKNIKLFFEMVEKKITLIKIENKFMPTKSLMTDKFEVVGYTKNVDNELIEYQFPQIPVAGADYPILAVPIDFDDVLGIQNMVKKNFFQQYIIIGVGIQIILKSQMNIRELVDRINNAETYIEIPINQGESIHVRIFIKPFHTSISQLHGIEKRYQQKVNELSKIISQEIQVKAPPPPPVLSPENLTTNAFVVVGHIVDPQTKSLGREYKFPITTKDDKKQKIEVLQEQYREKVLQALGLAETVAPTAPFNVKRSGTMVNIVLNKEINIREIVGRINNKEKVVSLPLDTEQEVSVRLFIKPMRYQKDLNEKKNAINELERTIAAGIDQTVEDSQRVQQLASSAQAGPASSARTVQPPTTVRQQPASSAQPTTGRGRGASIVSQGGSRGPYRHPNEEYNL